MSERHNAKIVSRLESEIATQWRLLQRWRKSRDKADASLQSHYARVVEETLDLLYVLFLVRGRRADRD